MPQRRAAPVVNLGGVGGGQCRPVVELPSADDRAVGTPGGHGQDAGFDLFQGVEDDVGVVHLRVARSAVPTSAYTFSKTCCGSPCGPNVVLDSANRWPSAARRDSMPTLPPTIS